jgi:hypothetical protein
LLVSGVHSFERFGGEFLGVTEGEIGGESIYFVPVAGESVPVKSSQWRLLEVTTGQNLADLGKTPHLGMKLMPNSAATLNQVGKGRVAYIPYNIFREFDRTRYPLVRKFVKDVVQVLAGHLDLLVEAPDCVDVIFRKKDQRKFIHLINQTDCKTHSIPWVGPIQIRVKLDHFPQDVSVAFEDTEMSWTYSEEKILQIFISRLYIHSTVIIK